MMAIPPIRESLIFPPLVAPLSFLHGALTSTPIIFAALRTKAEYHALRDSSAMEQHKDVSLWQCLATPTRIMLDILRNKKLIIVTIIYFLYYFDSDDVTEGVDGVTTSFSTTFSTETAAASTLR